MTKKVNKKARRLRTGLTLIETLVAISVLMVAVSGALSLSYKSLSSASFAKDQITAYYLAQDGMESIKNIRDENLLRGRNWMVGLSGTCHNNNKCKVDPIDLTVSSCSQTCEPLRFDEESGLYGYSSSWPESIYIREISLIKTTDDEELLVVEIRWRSGGIDKSFVVKETIFDWYDD
ncbi:MAG: prepilin-type N-terminal cleavage/methylation domain-containing protein [Patescibacteria group bacterium]